MRLVNISRATSAQTITFSSAICRQRKNFNCRFTGQAVWLALRPASQQTGLLEKYLRSQLIKTTITVSNRAKFSNN